MFRKGSAPGYSPKGEARALRPDAYCKRIYGPHNLVGYGVFLPGQKQAVVSARSAREAWEKALEWFLD